MFALGLEYVLQDDRDFIFWDLSLEENLHGTSFLVIVVVIKSQER